MSKGSNPTNVTTTTAAEPSEFIRPYFQQAIDYGQDLFESQTPQFFPEATYTGFAPQTETINCNNNKKKSFTPVCNRKENNRPGQWYTYIYA